ncbi:MAG: NAD(P)/FAD-dependent oxidoreductase [Telluria sp.]
MEPVVIVGAGMAAYGLAREFRKLDRATPLTIISSDTAASYAKPMLSNALALGKEAAHLAAQSAAQMAAQLDADVRPGVTALRIDPAARVLETTAGALAYGRLVLATGANPIRLPLEGDGVHAVHSVNHLSDYAALRTRLALLGRSAHVVILGVGLIGCEFADDLAGAGHTVTLVDPNPRLLSALAAPALSAGLAQAWTGRPVALRLGAVASSVDHDGTSLRVTLSDGAVLQADLVLSAVGLRPNMALARDAGIRTARGILVDHHGATSAAGVYALGDCAEYGSDGKSGTVMPYVAPLLAAARAIAATLAGTPTPIALKSEPVVVKTPSYRLALLPPAPGTEGAWHDERDGERTVARFIDRGGILRGFGLSHPTPALRQALLAGLHGPA